MLLTANVGRDGRIRLLARQGREVVVGRQPWSGHDIRRVPVEHALAPPSVRLKVPVHRAQAAAGPARADPHCGRRRLTPASPSRRRWPRDRLRSVAKRPCLVQTGLAFGVVPFRSGSGAAGTRRAVHLLPHHESRTRTGSAVCVQPVFIDARIASVYVAAPHRVGIRRACTIRCTVAGRSERRVPGRAPADRGPPSALRTRASDLRRVHEHGRARTSTGARPWQASPLIHPRVRRPRGTRHPRDTGPCRALARVGVVARRCRTALA